MLERDFYSAIVEPARAELAKLRDADEAALARLEFDDVQIEESDYLGIHAVVLFRDPARPECRFGWRWSWREDPKHEEVEFAAGVLAVNLEEDILSERYGLPAECVPDGITWF